MTQVYRQLEHALRGYFLNAGVTGDDVDDCLHNTWLRVLAALHEYDPAYGGFGPWVMGCAKHALGDWKRRDTYGRTRAPVAYVRGDKLRHLLVAHDMEDRILERIDRERLATAVDWCLRQLTPRQEQLVRAHYWQGRQWVELADERHTANAVKQAWLYGRARLRRTIEALMDPSVPMPRQAAGRRTATDNAGGAG